MYYFVEPEVAGKLGGNTVIDPSFHPPLITFLEYQFDGWLGDHLLESFPCFIISKEAATAIKTSGLTGFELDSVMTKRSEQFDDLGASIVLPEFLWLKISGSPGSSDFFIAGDNRLVISESAIKVIKKFGLANADFEDFN